MYIMHEILYASTIEWKYRDYISHRTLLLTTQIFRKLVMK